MIDFSQDTLTKVAQLVSTQITADSENLDLVKLLNVNSHAAPTMSGVSDIDYPQHPLPAGMGFPSNDCNMNLRQLSLVCETPVPPDILAEFANMQANCLAGIFPEVSRAWLTIDNVLYLWNYFDGSDPTYYDGLNESIVAVGLVKPKDGVFKCHIEFLLVLCTAVEIVVLGVRFTVLDSAVTAGPSNVSVPRNELILLPQPLYSLSTDSTLFTCVLGTWSGRVFMTGRDGCFYEFDYRSNEGWFGGKKCWKVNHSRTTFSYLMPPFLSFGEDEAIVQMIQDESRGLVFTRSENGTIRVFDLGASGNDFNRTAAMSEQTILNNASSIARTVDKSNFKKIVNIAVIRRSESQHINLVAITHTGARLYFATKGFNYSLNSRAYMLALVHVRLPPGFASVTSSRPTNVHKAFYSEGTLLLCSPNDTNSDVLWCVSKDSYSFHVPLCESQSCVDLDQNTWEVASVKNMKTQPATSLHRCDPPVSVKQFFAGRQQFVLLNGRTTVVLEKLQPVDQLRELMLDNGGPDTETVKSFFNVHKSDQACAMALLLATDDKSPYNHIHDWALRAILLYGGEPTFGNSSLQDSFHPSVSSTPFVGQLSTNRTAVGPFTHSAKFISVCVFLGRILRDFWELPFLAEQQCASVTSFVCRWQPSEICSALSSMKHLNSILKQLFDSSSSKLAWAADQMKQGFDDTRFATEAFRIEHTQYQHLALLSTKIEEFLAFLSVLMDHNITGILTGLSAVSKQQLKDIKFSDFVCGNTDMGSMLCMALINQFIVEELPTDALCDKLRDLCPSVFSADDAICAKANDLLQAGLKSPDPNVQEQLFQESLSMFKKVSHVVDIQDVCKYYQQADFCEGIVDLCICAAARKDPHNLAVPYYRNLKPADDISGRQAYTARQKCYQCIVNMLHYYYTIAQSDAHVRVQSPGKVQRRIPDQQVITTGEAANYFDLVIQECLTKNDETLHCAIYQWLFVSGLHDKILDHACPNLELFLTSTARSSSENSLLIIQELLWKFYEKMENYDAASRILCRLAERRSNSVSLAQRVNFLGRALVSIKSSTSFTDPQLLKEIEDKLEVAEVQKKVYAAVSNLSTIPPEEKEEVLNVLDCELYNLTQLFSTFVSDYSLSECKLAIVSVAGHSDRPTVERVWQELIDNLFNDTLHLDPATRVKVLSSQFAEIASNYGNNERFFPVSFIIKHMEKRSCELQMDSNWVFNLFHRLGLTPPDILNLYIDLWKSKETIWKVLGKPFHLLSVLSALIRHFVDLFSSSGDSARDGSRRIFVQIASEFTSKEVVNLSALASTDSTCKTLLIELKSLITRIDRMC